MKYENNAWNNTKIGCVYLDGNGCVCRRVSEDGTRTLYPYRAHKVYNSARGWIQDGWDNCSGQYTPAYFARMLRDGNADWR